MVSKTTYLHIVGIIGNVISFVMFASPMPTFLRIIKAKSVEQFKPDPYLATLLNCTLWIFYGLPIINDDKYLVATINGIGFVLEIIYITIFFIYARKNGKLKVVGWLLVELIFIGIVIVITMLAFHTKTKRSDFIGALSLIFVIGMYVSPLTIMKKVITTKSVEYMPFYLSLANFLNGITWVTYALIRFDRFILIGNGLGALSGAVQLILYACYCKSTPKPEEHAVGSSEVELGEANKGSIH